MRKFYILSAALATLVLATPASAANCSGGWITVHGSMGGSVDEYRAKADNIAAQMFRKNKCVKLTGNFGSAAALMASRIKIAYREHTATVREAVAAGQATWVGEPKVVRKANGGYEVIQKLGYGSKGGKGGGYICAASNAKLYFHKPNFKGYDANVKDTVNTWMARSGVPVGSKKVKWNTNSAKKSTPFSAIGIPNC